MRRVGSVDRRWLVAGSGRGRDMPKTCVKTGALPCRHFICLSLSVRYDVASRQTVTDEQNDAVVTLQLLIISYDDSVDECGAVRFEIKCRLSY